MYPKGFFVTQETGKKMMSLGLEKTMYKYIKNENGDIEIAESSKPMRFSHITTAVYAPTLGEIELSENGWKIFNALHSFSILSEIELRAYCWITERTLLGKREVISA